MSEPILARVFAKRFNTVHIRVFTQRLDGSWNRVGTLHVSRPEYHAVIRPALVAGGVTLDESRAERVN